jgi:predicted TIM-barrel fold metal-dependent hydrolase
MEFFDADTLIGRLIDQETADAPTVQDLLAEMDRTGVGRALVSHWKIAYSNPDWGNEEILAAVKGQPRLRPLLGIWPVPENDVPSAAEQVDRAIKAGAAGVQLWPQLSAYDVTPWMCPDLWLELGVRRLPAFVHADQVNYGQVHDVLRAFPELRLVLQRVPYGDARRLHALMRACPNLILCCSPHFVGDGAVEHVCKYFGAERIIFGSGLFKYDQLPSVAQVRYARLNEAQMTAIASGNLDRLLGEIR